MRVLAPLHKQSAVDELRKLDKQRQAVDLPTQGRIEMRNERRHAEIHALHNKGLTITAIAGQLDLNRRTVRKFLGAGSAAELQRTLGAGPSRLDRFAAYLVRRWQEGCQVAAYLHEEIRAQGYHGSKRSVRRFVEGWRRSQPPPPVRRLLPGPQTMCWLLLRRRSDLDDAEQMLLNDLCRRSSEVAVSRRLAQRFMILVRERSGQRSMDCGRANHWPARVARLQPQPPPRWERCTRRFQIERSSICCANECCWRADPDVSTFVLRDCRR